MNLINRPSDRPSVLIKKKQQHNLRVARSRRIAKICSITLVIALSIIFKQEFEALIFYTIEGVFVAPMGLFSYFIIASVLLRRW